MAISEMGEEEEEEGRHFQRQGDRNTTEEGVEVGTMTTVAYMLEGKKYRRELWGGGGGGYNDTPNSLIYLTNLVVFANGG